MRGASSARMVAVAVGLSSAGWLGACVDPSEPQAWTISGTVRGASAGAVVALDGACRRTTTTDAAGRYAFAGLGRGDYVVAPTSGLYAFEPAERLVSLPGGDAVGQDFAATPKACAGDFSLGTPREVAAFAALECSSVRSLTITGPDIEAVLLPHLRTVTEARACNEMTGCDGGLVVLDNPSLTALAFPALFEARSLAIAHNARLSSLSLPALTSVPVATGNIWCHAYDAGCGGGFRVLDNASLVELGLPSLSRVATLRISSNPSLRGIVAPLLTDAGNWVEVTDNPALPQCLAEDLLSHLAGFTGLATLSGNDLAATCLAGVACDGDVTISSAAELEAFLARRCESISGRLSLAGTDLTSVILPDLARVTALRISGNPALTAVSLPSLRSVAGAQDARSLPECGPYFGPTGTFQSAIAICDNAALVTVDLPALAAIHSAVVIRNAALASVNLPALTTISSPHVGMCDPCWTTGGLLVGGPGPSTLSLPSLTSGDVQVGLPALTRLDLPRLAAGSVMVSDCDALTSLSLPVLAGGEMLAIVENGALAEVSAPALRFVTAGLSIIANPAYPQCAAEALLARLSTVPNSVILLDNDTLADCPP